MRLRRARLAGALVALGILFYLDFAGLLVQRAVISLSMLPSLARRFSPADAGQMERRFWQGREVKQPIGNDNRFS